MFSPADRSRQDCLEVPIRAARHSDAWDAAARYDKLERAVAPCYYANREGFQDVMRDAITLNGSFLSTHRMVLQCLYDAYRGGGAVEGADAGESTD